METTESTQAPELTIESIFEAAEAEEASLATDSDAEPVSPAGDAEADDAVEDIEEVEVEEQVEQAEAVDEFDFDTDDGEEADETPTLDLTQKVEVKGHGEIAIEDLVSGYMKDADYTQGKQALAEEKRAFAEQQEAAAKIMQSLEDDPVGVAAYLAVETGLLTQADLDGQKIEELRDVVKVPKADEVEAEIERRVAEQLEAHPEVAAARADKVRQAIDAEFAAIAEDLGKPLSEAAKLKVIQYAETHEVYDLRVAFDALSAETARKQAKKAKLNKAAPDRPKTRGTGVSAPVVEVNTVDDALALALAQHGQE